ncbi:MAG: hypothetical protein WAP91_00305, partial [Bacilli bacterium]
DLCIVFTDVIKILKQDFDDKDFARMLEIGSAFNALRNNPSIIGHYLREYNRYVAMLKDPDAQAKLNESVDKLIEHFRKSPYLYRANSNFLKAAVGYIMINKYETATEFKERQTRLKDFIKEQIDAETRIVERKLVHISNIIAGVKNLDEKLAILYPKSKLARMSKKERDEAKEIIRQIELLPNLLSKELAIADKRNIVDTFEVAQAHDEKLFEQLPSIIKYHETLSAIERTKNSLRGLNASQKRAKNNKYKFAYNDTQSVVAKQAELNNKLIAAEKDLEYLNKQLKETEKLKKAIHKEIIYKIFSRNKGLITLYVDNVSKYVDEETERIQEEFTKEYNKTKYPKAFIDEYKKREAMAKQIRTYFQTEEAKVLRRILNDGFKVMNEDVYSKYIQLLYTLNINSLTEAIEWFTNASIKRDEILALEAELEKTPYLRNANGRPISWKYYYDKLTAAEARRDAALERLDTYLSNAMSISNENLEGTISDKQKDLVIYFINKTYQDLKEKQKTQLQDVFKKVKGKYTDEVVPVDAITDNNITKTKKRLISIRDRVIEAQGRFLSKLQEDLGDHITKDNYATEVDNKITSL